MPGTSITRPVFTPRSGPGGSELDDETGPRSRASSPAFARRRGSEDLGRDSASQPVQLTADAPTAPPRRCANTSSQDDFPFGGDGGTEVASPGLASLASERIDPGSSHRHGDSRLATLPERSTGWSRGPAGARKTIFRLGKRPRYRRGCRLVGARRGVGRSPRFDVDAAENGGWWGAAGREPDGADEQPPPARAQARRRRASAGTKPAGVARCRQRSPSEIAPRRSDRVRPGSCRGCGGGDPHRPGRSGTGPAPPSIATVAAFVADVLE